MRKILTLIATIGVFTCGYAQEQTEVSVKPNAGNFTAEVNFNPFSSAPVNINYLRFRKFTSPLSAIRFGVSAGGRSETPEKDIKQTTFYVNVRPGFEKHFAGTERLSPYIGFDLDIAIKTSKFVSEVDGEELEVTGAWNTNGTQRGNTRIGANVIIGADYYFAKRLYIGTEFGFGFENVKNADIKVDLDFGIDPDKIKGGSTFEVGPNFNSSLRLGFVF